MAKKKKEPEIFVVTPKSDSEKAASGADTLKKKPTAARERKPVKKKKIIFVCTGNTCRSPMAEHIFKRFLKIKRKTSKYEVSSAGLDAAEGEPMAENAVEALKEMGITVKPPHKARQLTPPIAREADLIVCMTASHKYALGEFADKAATVGELTGGHDVPDPYMGSLQVYERTAEYLAYAAEDIFAAAEKIGKAES